jgi:hypothetical protein
MCVYDKEVKKGRWRNLVKEGVVQSRGRRRPRLSDVEGWDNSQPKRVARSALSQGQKAWYRGRWAIYCHRAEGAPYQGLFLLKGRGEHHNPEGTIYCHWAEGSAITRRARTRGSSGDTTVPALGRTPAKRGDAILTVGAP